MENVSLAELRRYIVAHQGYAARSRRARPNEVLEAVRRLSCVQLDSISTVERSHRIALASRVGDYPRGTDSRFLATGRTFEYWAHEACLVPIEDWPLFRYRMHELRDTGWWKELHSAHPSLREEVLGAIRERGPLGSRHFEGDGGAGMWNWKPAKRMLDRLWTSGELVISAREGFQRLYDLPERVIPTEFLAAPRPSEAEWLRGLTLRAVRARGALTEAGVREHYRLKGGAARLRPHVDALVAEGLLRRVAVEDGEADVLVPAEAVLDGNPTAPALLSPFDNLLWDRPFARRVLGFDHLIEVYKPQPERRFGYYVLPFLRGDRIVGRADLKSERAEGRLVVKAFHRESGVRASTALDDALDRALDRLARTIGLEEVRR
ncbi:MAG: winged helix-turn-helix domain-containing protein [Gaiellaceae bacterium]